MAIQWKHTYNYQKNVTGVIPGGSSSATAGNAFGAPFELCSAVDKMNTIKSISFANGNNVDPVYVSLWIDSSGLATTSPEYSAYDTYIIRNIKIQPLTVVTFPIDYATWSSNGAVLNMSLASTNLTRTHTVSNAAPFIDATPNAGGWMQGSVMLSGNADKNYDFKLD